MGKSTGTSTDLGFFFGYDARHGDAGTDPGQRDALQLGVIQAHATTSHAFVSDALLIPGFYHVAGTFDGSTARVYVNGALVVTATVSIGFAAFNTLPLRIGAMHFLEEFGVDDRFQGIIDEVKLFDRALLPSEIADIFNAGSAGQCKSQGARSRRAVNPSKKTTTPIVRRVELRAN